ncbi:15532_t:CDS:10, partial [Racocetra fulgida]
IDTCEWVSNQIDALSTQIETAEAEAELLQSAVKKGRKDATKADRLGEVENTIERHKFHVNRLELILRLLENGNIPAEKEPDFAEDENIYDELNLEEEEELWGITNEDHHSNDESNSDEPRTPPKDPSSPATSPTTRIVVPKPPIPASAPTRKTSNPPEPLPQRSKEEDKQKLPPPAILTGSSITSVNSLQSPPSTSAAYPPLKSAPLTGPTRTLAAVVAKQGIDTTPPVSTPQPISIIIDPLNDSDDTSRQHYLQSNDVQQKQSQLPLPSSQSINQQRENLLPSQEQPQPREIPSVQPPAPTHSSVQGPSQHEPPSSAENRIPAALADLVQSYEAAEEKCKQRALGKEDGFHIQQMLDASLQYVPESLDAERYYHEFGLE